MTHGDRRATETRDLSRFNIDNKYGRTALEATMRAIMGYEAPIVPPPKDYKGDFFKGQYYPSLRTFDGGELLTIFSFQTSPVLLLVSV